MSPGNGSGSTSPFAPIARMLSSVASSAMRSTAQRAMSTVSSTLAALRVVGFRSKVSHASAPALSH